MNSIKNRSLKYKYYLIAVISLVAVSFGIRYAALVIVDPLQLFHKPWVRDPYYFKEMRLQAAGIIKYEKFDSIILGTSMAANFSAKEASSIWNAKFINLSPNGAWFSERSLILNFALHRKKIKNVIYSLDRFRKYGQYPASFPATDYKYIYNRYDFDDIQIYSNKMYNQYIYCQNLAYPKKHCMKTGENLEDLVGWAKYTSQTRRFGGLDKWFDAAKDIGQIQRALNKIAKETKAIRNNRIKYISKNDYLTKLKDKKLSFDHYVLRYVEKYPNTHFYFFFPPYSRMHNAFLKRLNPMEYELYLDKIRYVVNSLDRYPNARVFGFDQLGFTNKLKNYKDTMHYHPRFNSAMLKWMKKGRFELTSKSIEKYLGLISAQVDKYDVLTFGSKIESFLNANK